jgi:uncharacterized membrane protein
MKAKALNVWYKIRSSYWFVPVLMASASVALAFITIIVDVRMRSEGIRSLAIIFGSDPDAARLLLATIAGAMATVAGVTYSIIIVTLTLASNQFGHRLLANFMRDIGNQIVLGIFIATFLHSLLVLLAVGHDINDPFIPYISIIVSVLLALVSVVVLIFFIHHATEVIQAKNLIARVSHDLNRVIDRVFPTESEDHLSSNTENNSSVNLEVDAAPIMATGSGYLQAIDWDNLVKVAAENGLILSSQYRVGKFVIEGTPLLLVWPKEKLNRQLAEKLRNRFILGDQRTYEQDIEFAIDQLVEIAVRALSPAINDPFTAMMCIDRLGTALSQLATREFPSVEFADESGKLRLVGKPTTFASLVDTAFSQIRQQAGSHAAVIIRLLEVLAVIAERTTREEDRLALLRHSEMIRRSSEENLPEGLDRQDVEQRYQGFQEALKKSTIKQEGTYFDRRGKTIDESFR